MEKLYKIQFFIFLLTCNLVSYVANAQTTLTISGSSSVCVGDVSTYSLSPLVAGATFSWTVSSQGNVLNSGSLGVIQWIATGNATITVQGVDTAGTPIALGTLNVTINDIPQPNITPSTYVTCAVEDTIPVKDGYCTQVCENGSVTYSVVHEMGVTYNWSVNGEESFTVSANSCTVVWGDVGYGNVAVEVVQGSCIGTDLICIEIIESPEALFETFPGAYQQNLEVCLNSSILFFDQSSAPDDSPIISWVWDFGDGSVMSNGVGSAGNPVEHSYSHTGFYGVKLIVTNACGCVDTYTIGVTVSEYEGIQIECPRVVCDGDQIEYTVNNPSCNTSSWSVYGGQIIAQNDQSATVDWNDVDELGFGYLTYNNECEPCAGKTTVKIPVITDNAAIQGPANVCPNTIYNYYMPQWPSIKWDWSLTGDATYISPYPSNVLSVLSGASGSFAISIFSCNGLLDCDAYTSMNVNISPQAYIIGNQESCIYLSSEYTLSNATSAIWTLTSPSGIATEYNNQASINPTFTEAGTYTLEITGNFCSPDLFQITVHARPQAPTILGPDSVCKVVPIQYSTSPQISVTTTHWIVWQASASPAIGSITNITFNSLPTNIFALNVRTDEAQCASTVVYKTIFPAAPQSISMTTDAPADLTVCGSSQWAFDVDYTDGDLYQWKILDPAMGSIVAGNNSPNIEVLFNNPLGNSEDVDVIVSVTKCNQILRDTLTIQVVNAPEYTVTPGDTTICAGEPLSFSISPTPLLYDSLIWDFGDGFSSNDANTTHTYPNGGNIAQYTPVATIVHPGGCLVTVTLQAGPVEVKPAPVALLSPTGTQISCGPISTTLSATVTTGFGSTTNYAWDGPPVPSPPNCASCDTWTISQYGNYQVVVENSNGCQGVSNTVRIVENCSSGNCLGPLFVASSSSFIDCSVVQANIQYSPNGFNIISETWVFPPEAIVETYNLDTTATATASFEEAGEYTFNYIVESGNGTCTKIFHQSVYVPFVGDMRYTASCGSGSFYDITLYDHSNIFPSEEGFINHSYAYHDGTAWHTITAPDSALSVNILLPAGDYQFREIIYSTLTTAAPPCTTLVGVILPDKPDADFEIVSSFIPACINDVVVHLNNLTTPATGLNYVWNFDEGPTNYQPNPDKVYGSLPPSGQFTITLTATNNIGCVDSTQSSIDIKDNGWWDGSTKPTLSTSPSPPVCIGTPIALTYNSFPNPAPPNFIWYQGSTPITPVVTASSFDVTQAGDYWVMGSDQYGCLVPSNPASVYFTQIQTPTIIGNPAQCDSVPFTLTSSINGAAGINLEWERSPGGVVGSGSSLFQTLAVGTYTYTLTATQNGCEGVSVPYTVTVASPVESPALSFNITSCEPYVVELTATNVQSGTYNWNNGSTGSTVNGYTGGLFEVYFTSNSGCKSSNEISVPHSPQQYMWNFPTGCFCTDDLRDGDNISTCAAWPRLVGSYIPFTYWSYQVNGVDVLTGMGTYPSGFSTFEPDSINLILDNGYCHIISDAMYLSADCYGSSPQGLIPNGTSPNELYSQADIFNQNIEQLEPEIRLIPNPAADQTRIQYRFGGSESHKTIEISGRRFKTLRPQNDAGSITLQLGDFVSGIYQICLRQDGRIIAQSKLSVAP